MNKGERKPVRQTSGEIRYPDEETKRAGEIFEKVQEITATMPPEGAELKIQAVTFSPEHEFVGWNVVFTAGTVIPTDNEDIMLVPRRTLDVLTRMNIPYELAPFPLG